jgi:hypothetical protein
MFQNETINAPKVSKGSLDTFSKGKCASFVLRAKKKTEKRTIKLERCNF